MATKKIDFYIINSEGQWSLRSGYPLTIKGFPFKFAVLWMGKDKGNNLGEDWYVTNLETGACVACGETRKIAKARAEVKITSAGLKQVSALVKDSIDRNGPAPLVEGNGCE